MSIQLSENESRVRYTLAQSVSQSVFAVPFEFFEDADLTVFVDSVVKVEGADYTVSGGGGSTGNITFLVALVGGTGGSIIEIVRRIAVERTTDFLPGADINRAALNQQLDTLTAMIGDVNDKADRSLRISDSDFGLTDLPDNATRKGKVLAFNESTGNVEAGPTISGVNTVSQLAAQIQTLAEIEDGTVATGAITTAAGIASDITAVAAINSNVVAVAGNETNINIVATDLTGNDDIGTVAGSIANVNITASNIGDVNVVAGDLNTADNIGAVAGSISNVNTVGSNITDVNTVAGISSDVTAVAADATDIGVVAADLAGADTIGTVAGNIANVNTVAGIDADVTAVAGDVTNIGIVATNITDVNTVAGISANVTTVAGISANVTAVAADATDIGTVSSNIADVNTVASISADVTTVAGITANIAAVVADEADIGTVAANIADVSAVAAIDADVSAVAADATDIGTVATNIADVSAVADINADVSTVADISADVTTLAGISADITALAEDFTTFFPTFGEILHPVNKTFPTGWYDTTQRLLSGVSERAILSNSIAWNYQAGSIAPDLVFDPVNAVYVKNGGQVAGFSDLVTHTRASTATFVDADGILQTAATNVPRVGHHVWNGSSWVNEGLLHESEARTNSLLRNDFSGGTVGVIGSGGVAPTGMSTGNSLGSGAVTTIEGFGTEFGMPYMDIRWQGTATATPQTCDLTFNLFNTVPAATGQTWTSSCFARIVAGGFPTAAGSIFRFQFFERNGGTVLVAPVSDVATPTSTLSRVHATNALTQATTDNLTTRLEIRVSSGAVVDVTIRYYMPQLEQGATPSSPIMTTGSAVTRAADVLTVPAANLPYNSTALSIQMDGRVTYADQNLANNAELWRWGGSEFLHVRIQSNTTPDRYLAVNSTVAGGFVAISFGSGQIVEGILSPTNTAARFTSTQLQAASNGTFVAPATAATILPNLSATNLQLGSNYNGTIRTFRMWGQDIQNSGLVEATS